MSTLRGHADSVNGAAFIPFLNTLATCSADKSVSLWDTRSVSCVIVKSKQNNFFLQGLCVHTFYGHHHACCSLQPTFQVNSKLG